MPQETSLEQSYLVLVKFLMLSKRRIFELGSEHDITGMQAMTVFLLDSPRPIGSLRKIYNCDASNITGIIDGLEQKGLVTRYEDPADRRLKMVELTPEGLNIRIAIIKQMMSHNSPLLSRLSADELVTFIALLQKITAPEAQI